MPHIATQHFGTVEYNENAVVSVPSGLPGFADQTRFLILEQPATAPLVFLQSLKTPALCFLTLPVRAVAADFELRMEPEDLALLELPVDRQPVIGTDVLVLVIISVDEKEPPTGNLLAPVVVNLKTRRGVQAVQANSGYPHRYPLDCEGKRC